MKIKKILVPLDFSDGSMAALSYAVVLAEKFQASVELLYVDEATFLLNPVSPYADTDLKVLTDRVREYARNKWEEIARAYEGRMKFQTRFVIGRPYREIIASAEKNGDDLIVMGTSGESGWNAVVGSNAERVVRRAPCPVLTIRRAENKPVFGRILIPVDFSDLARQATGEALNFCKIWSAEAVVIYVALSHGSEEESDIQKRMMAFLDKIDRSNVACRTLIERSHTEGGGIIEAAEKHQADMIMMGTHGRTGLKKVLLGSVATEVVNNASRPVLVIRSFR